MDNGLILVVGVALGALGTSLLLWLLLLLDPEGSENLSTLWRHLGAQRDQLAQDNKTAAVVPPMISREKVLPVQRKSEDPDKTRRAPGGNRPITPAGRVLFILIMGVLSGCASVGGGAGEVHGAAVSGFGRTDTARPPASPRTEELPICGMEDPYLPDPCRMEVTKGEWLRVSNVHPSKPTKHHSKLWWLLITLVTF